MCLRTVNTAYKATKLNKIPDHILDVQHFTEYKISGDLVQAIHYVFASNNTKNNCSQMCRSLWRRINYTLQDLDR